MGKIPYCERYVVILQWDSILYFKPYFPCYIYIYIYIYICNAPLELNLTLIILYELHTISFQNFFVWALLLIVHTWNSCPLRSNLHQLQCTSCIVPTTSGRPHRNPLVWACQWPSSQSILSPHLSHNDSLWA